MVLTKQIRSDREAYNAYMREYLKQRRRQQPGFGTPRGRKPKPIEELKPNSQRMRVYNDNNPEKVKARTALRNAVRAGYVSRPNACEICDVVGRVEGDHDDYSKPFNVTWLCRPCHLEVTAYRKTMGVTL